MGVRQLGWYTNFAGVVVSWKPVAIAIGLVVLTLLLRWRYFGTRPTILRKATFVPLEAHLATLSFPILQVFRAVPSVLGSFAAIYSPVLLWFLVALLLIVWGYQARDVGREEQMLERRKTNAALYSVLVQKADPNSRVANVDRKDLAERLTISQRQVGLAIGDLRRRNVLTVNPDGSVVMAGVIDPTHVETGPERGSISAPEFALHYGGLLATVAIVVLYCFGGPS